MAYTQFNVTYNISDYLISATTGCNISNGSVSRSNNNMTVTVPAYKTGQGSVLFKNNLRSILALQGYSVTSNCQYVRISAIRIQANTSTTAAAATKQYPVTEVRYSTGDFGSWTLSSSDYVQESFNFGTSIDRTYTASNNKSYYNPDNDYIELAVAANISSNSQWAQRTYTISNIKVTVTIQIYQRNYSFKDGNNADFSSGTIDCYKIPSNPSGTPTKSSTTEYDYTFTSWEHSTDNNRDVVNPYEVRSNYNATRRFINNIYMGPSKINTVYIGNTPIREIYVGTTKIYG